MLRSDSLDVDGAADITGSVDIGGELNLMGTSDGDKYLDARVGSGGTFTIRGTLGGDANHSNLATFTRNGAVNLYNAGQSKLSTKSDGVNITGELECDTLDVDGAGDITGVLTLHNDLDMQDSDAVMLGTGDDLRLFHNGSNSLIENYNGGLYIDQRLDDGDIYIRSDDGSGGLYLQASGGDGQLRLYHYGNLKLNTKSDGVTVTGEVQSDSLNCNGADIDLNSASEVTSIDSFVLTEETTKLPLSVMLIKAAILIFSLTLAALTLLLVSNTTAQITTYCVLVLAITWLLLLALILLLVVMCCLQQTTLWIWEPVPSVGATSTQTT